jgi:hypothetical protein
VQVRLVEEYKKQKSGSECFGSGWKWVSSSQAAAHPERLNLKRAIGRLPENRLCDAAKKPGKPSESQLTSP